ncbi:MAG: citrate synthase [Acholeplasmatales bacterium]|nr:citrate synthase [Acholeplasmatales bacterium]
MDEFLLEKYHNLLQDGKIEPELYDLYRVKKGLRNDNGTGVLVGLTKVAEVSGYNVENDIKLPKKGNLYYRGIDITDVVKLAKDDYGYLNTCFLLLFGHYPNSDEAKQFKDIIKDNYDLPEGYLEDVILKSPSKSLMNHIARCILALYSYDNDPDNLDGFELIKKAVSLIGKMPAIIAYSLQAKTHYLDRDSLHIHFPRKEYSFAENILYLSRNDGKFTEVEAKTLDRCLMVHADHGGGNNSAFVGTCVASTLTDIYAMITASLSSLKGPRHGGANMAVQDMMSVIINDIGLDASDAEIKATLTKILNKEYFDKTGLIYGLGHAIYTLSDPRCEILRAEAKKLAIEKKIEKKYEFYLKVERIGIELLETKTGKKCCANVDYYSGLIYDTLNIPRDLFIPIFACARIVGWVAHDIETLLYCNKIVRPATKYVGFKED